MEDYSISLSVALAVYNEESRLGDCLESIKHIAKEIVVVDGGSTDRTVSIAERYGANIIKTTNPPVFHINKQKALDACRGKWILQLDADERVSKELAEEIITVTKLSMMELRGYVVQDKKKRELFLRHEEAMRVRDGALGKDSGEVVAFFVPRSNYFLGKFLKHGGAYPDGTIRLVQKGKAKYALKDVHDQMMVDGDVRWLEHDLLHYADPEFSRYLSRSNRYTSLQSSQWLELKKYLAEKKPAAQAGGQQAPRSSIQELPSISLTGRARWMFWEPVKTFVKIYFRHKGLLDGFPGFVWAMYSGLHVATSYVKYWEKSMTKRV